MDYLLVGEFVRNIRTTELKKSKEEFASEIGISLRTLKRLETAESKVSNIEIFYRISKLSGYTLEQIITASKDVNKKDKLIIKINNMLEDFTEKDLENIFNIIQSCKLISEKKKNSKK